MVDVKIGVGARVDDVEPLCGSERLRDMLTVPFNGMSPAALIFPA